MADVLVSAGLYLQTVGLTVGSHWKKDMSTQNTVKLAAEIPDWLYAQDSWKAGAESRIQTLSLGGRRKQED